MPGFSFVKSFRTLLNFFFISLEFKTSVTCVTERPVSFLPFGLLLYSEDI